MQKTTQLIFMILILSSSRSLAHVPEEGKIYVTSGPFIFRSNTRERVAQDSPDLGAGIVAEGDVDQNGGVEIAMFYIDQLYVRKADDTFLAERIKRMHITTGYRHWFRPSVSFGGALFSSYSMGDAKKVDGNLSRDDAPTTASEITEYGLDFSGQWEIWANTHVAMVADARYMLSLTKKPHEDANVYGVLLGVKYLLQK